MTEKNQAEELDDEWAPYRDEGAMASRIQAEDDLRIRMFALDMAVTALPSLTSPVDSEDRKIQTVQKAALKFERYLRGEN